ncbi:uncharacterized protein LOC135845150 [Planococcus citri]|uniref:uncharacterized protein LOC135845150 n=1 Tax=Planococcus citri TaxID=170843 RepID=UPI0031F8D9C4
MSHCNIIICIVASFILPSLGEPSVFWQHKLHNWTSIIPDVLDEIPENLEKCRVIYPSGAEVNLGNYLSRNQTHKQPNVTWTANQSDYYIVVLEDPDSPTPMRPTMRENMFWMVVNIPGNNVSAGETILEYQYPAVSPTSGIHRNIFLVYKQPGILNYTQERKSWIHERGARKIRPLAAKYSLQGPVAINFFLHRIICMAWKNETEKQKLREKICPSHDVIMAKLKSIFKGHQIPDVYFIESHELPSIERGYKTKMYDLIGRMKEEEIIPDILKEDEAPLSFCRIFFTSNYTYKLFTDDKGLSNDTIFPGKEIRGMRCQHQPLVTWRSVPELNYTLVYVALDVPHRGNPFAGPFLQWLVVNIPGNNVTAGTTVAKYTEPGGERKGLHRHVFLIYHEPPATVFNEVDYDNWTLPYREQFFPQKFSKKYGLGNPWAGNFFMSPD